MHWNLFWKTATLKSGKIVKKGIPWDSVETEAHNDPQKWTLFHKFSTSSPLQLSKFAFLSNQITQNTAKDQVY